MQYKHFFIISPNIKPSPIPATMKEQDSTPAQTLRVTSETPLRKSLFMKKKEFNMIYHIYIV